MSCSAGEKEKGVESDVREKGVESDVRVLMETTVNNCNILHVCCGGEEGFMTTFDPAIGEKLHLKLITRLPLLRTYTCNW